MQDKIPIKPKDRADVEQIKAIRNITACGVMDAKKLAIILNRQGFLTWGDVHRNTGCYV